MKLEASHTWGKKGMGILWLLQKWVWILLKYSLLSVTCDKTSLITYLIAIVHYFLADFWRKNLLNWRTLLVDVNTLLEHYLHYKSKKTFGICYYIISIVQFGVMQYWKHQYFLLVMIFNNQTSVLLLSNILYQFGPIPTDQALVVVGADNAIHSLNLYLVDSMVIFLHTCPFK